MQVARTAFHRLLPHMPELVWGVVLVAIVFNAVVKKAGDDFGVFWLAGQRVLAGYDLYPLLDGFYAYKYLPIGAVLFVPFAFLQFKVAYLLWNLLNAAALLDVFRRLRRVPLMVGGVEGHAVPTAGVGAAALTLLLTSPSWNTHFPHGQIDCLLLWLVVQGEFWQQARPAARWQWRSALAWTLAAAIKPPLALLIVRQAWLGHWRTVLLCVGFGAGCLLAPTLWLGLEGNFNALRGYRAIHERWSFDTLAENNNQGLAGLITHGLTTDWGWIEGALSAKTNSDQFRQWRPWILMLYGVTGGGLLVAAALVFRRWRRTVSADPALAAWLSFTLTLALACFLSPTAWRAIYVAWLPLWIIWIRLQEANTWIVRQPKSRWRLTWTPAAVAGFFTPWATKLGRVVLLLAALLPVMLSYDLLRVIDPTNVGEWFNALRFAGFFAWVWAVALAVWMGLLGWGWRPIPLPPVERASHSTPNPEHERLDRG